LTWGGRDAWLAATPLLALAVVAAGAIGACALRAGEHDAPRSFRPERRAGAAFWLAAGILLLSTIVPGVILAFALREPRSLATFWSETGGGMDLLRSLALAGIVALVGVVLA